MSYILDSLKKSEQQRKQMEQPGLHSEPLGLASRRPTGRKIWPYLVIPVLLLNAGLLGWYLVNAGAPEAPPEVVRPAVQPTPSAGVQKPEIPPADPRPADAPPMPRIDTPVEVPVLAAANHPVTSAPAVAAEPVRPAEQSLSVATSEPVRPVETGRRPADSHPEPVDRLPVSVQQQLPPLVLSLHYFAGAGATSMIRLDGVILRVGDQVEEGLTVAEILVDGVVLDFRGRLIWLDRPQG